MSLTGWIHVIAAMAALVVGGIQFLLTKGTPRHALLGRAYAVLMLLLNVSALATYSQTGHWGVFHWMSLSSLCTLAVGVASIQGRYTAPSVYRHGVFMGWSYVGLVAAGVAQLTHAVMDAVLLPAVAVLVVGGILVHALTPSAAIPVPTTDSSPCRL